MTAVYLRELRSYFITPIGYIYAAMFLAVSGMLFGMTTLMTMSTTSLADYFIYLMGVFCILIPLLTMKLLSDERRTKTEQLLLTSPVSLFGMIMGKYLASLTVFAATLLLNSFNFFLLYMYGTVGQSGSIETELAENLFPAVTSYAPVFIGSGLIPSQYSFAANVRGLCLFARSYSVSPSDNSAEISQSVKNGLSGICVQRSSEFDEIITGISTDGYIPVDGGGPFRIKL